jgi:uncharacterized protein
MKVVVAGGSGFLGSALVQALEGRGDAVTILSRRGPNAWTPDGTAGPWAAVLDGADAVVNLAGEPMADRRWTSAHKRRILESRVLSTRSIVEGIRAVSRQPPVLLNGSGVGFYPDSDAVVDEESAAGTEFLARVCLAWEAEARRAEQLQCRVVLLRSAVVLHRDGGALRKMLLPFRLGLGGPIGSGSQWWSWIHRADWVRLALWALDTKHVQGPTNVCAPEPARNREVMNALARSLRRPALLPAPAFALRLLMGDAADDMLLASQRAVPRVARENGFVWAFPDLQAAMDDAVRVSPEARKSPSPS